MLTSNEVHAESSSAATARAHMLELEHHSEPVTVYDIFLSHSGAQKGFAKDLYKVLSPLYNTFFDIKRHSLPPGDHFPSCILNAARQCRLAVVVLSEEFVCSKWPMLELCAFVDALPSVKILPLFFLLSPSDLKDQGNLKRWQNAWNNQQDAKCRVDVSKWACALALLRSLNGLVFDPSEGLLTYLDEITSSISDMMSPAIKCDDNLINGKDRLCKVILDKFKDMESREQPPHSSKAFVLGLYGPPGSGKSKMTMFLRDHFFPHFRCKVLYMMLPSEYRSSNQEEMVKTFKKLLDLTDFRNRINLDKISDVSEIEELRRSDFLRTSTCGFSVHDVHAEFAHSIKEDSTMQFLGSLRRWMTYKCTDPDEVGRDLLLRQDEMNNYCQVRTMILEVGEGCKRITLNGLSSLKALVVRNSKSLTVLELVGLTSLVSLDIQTCPNLRWVEAPQEDDYSAKRLMIWDADGYIRQEEKSSRLVVQQKSEELQCISSFRKNFR